MVLMIMRRDLFIQALAAMENAKESDWYSYYQIAGMKRPI